MFAYCGNTPVMYSDISGFFPEWLRGVSRIVTGALAVVAGVAVIASGVALVSMIVVATITMTAGGLTILNGAADIQQSISGNNYIRDNIFGGNQSGYNLYAGITEGVAIVGSIICGSWLKYNKPRIQTYKNVGNYNYSATISDAEHMSRPFQTSTLLQREVTKYGSMLHEGGSVYTFAEGGWKLVVDVVKQTIYHFGPF